MRARTYTVGAHELMPIDSLAARVVSRGPQWCAPADKPLARQGRKSRNPREPYSRELARLHRIMTDRDKAHYRAIVKPARCHGKIEPAERVAIACLVLGLPLSFENNRAMTRIARLAAADATLKATAP